ncbi:MAG: hypothetical protein AAGE94_18755 [Acidobacteriota bacterium]
MQPHDYIPGTATTGTATTGDTSMEPSAITDLEPWLVDVVTAHPSSLDLVEYALGLEPGAMDDRRPLDRALLERHLATCPACRREVAMVTAEDTVVDVDFGATPPATAPVRRQAALGRRFLATAAGLVLAVAMGTWLDASLDKATAPTTVATYEEPMPVVERAAATERAPSVGLFFDGFESGSLGTWSDTSTR